MQSPTLSNAVSGLSASTDFVDADRYRDTPLSSSRDVARQNVERVGFGKAGPRIRPCVDFVDCRQAIIPFAPQPHVIERRPDEYESAVDTVPAPVIGPAPG